MKVLFLDDDPNRRRIAREHFIGHELSEAETAKQAIDMLDKYSPFDLVHLDHDLGGEVFVPSDEVSGFAVAQHICSMEKAKRPRRIVVHSFNPVGANNMMHILRNSFLDCEYRPFDLYRPATPTPQGER